MSTAPGRLTVDIVIVNWNAGHHLGNCLRSIARADQSVLHVGKVVVVDNASSDGSDWNLHVTGLPLRWVRNTENHGFARACNQGAALCDSEFLLFLNPDTELCPDTLRITGEALRTPGAAGFGIFGAHMVDEQGRPQVSCSRFPNPRIYVGRMTGLDRLAPALFPTHHMRPEEVPRSGPVDQVIGAFFLVRRPLFTELNGFDDGYFLYLEEVDFALRARRLSWPSYYIKEARVHHVGQVSSVQLGPWRHYLLLCSRTRYMFRHWPKYQAWLITALSLSVEPVARMVGAALRGQRVELRATLAVHREFLRWLRRDHELGPPSAPPAAARLRQTATSQRARPAHARNARKARQ
ncbi:glycosyltransferase family 2 protein [Streptomyces sp. NBC_01352]|uniref:Glycosyltransferase 2-like domain-containing protein n=1 Tax=Streptomyces plumbiresistens TaxID=511811 RepID=A0ABP7T3B8_9ACTN|nr:MULTISPECIES: glycosyltransferase family 2 protein [unclassified Streptomyces]MCX4705083.1 glycosyltransferase family 2 protein [Streptomyces sp. NBC_01373]